jgi:putative endonuclease
MPFYVYILQSEADGSFYKGYTLNPQVRLQQHNNGETSSTRSLVPWKLVHVEEWDNKRDALIREKNLKKADRARIIALIASPKNIVNKFIDSLVSKG